MEKTLYFMETATDPFAASGDAAAFRESTFRGMHNTGTSSVVLRMEFDSLLAVPDSNDGSFVTDAVQLTVNADTHKKVAHSIVSALNADAHKSSFIVVADDNNSLYIDSDITGCTISVAAEA
jgi:hypothetical protein|tara:strand:- start:51 stop:416 length:366 start_codon:yes stop_codon:yes gene_type:complete